MISEIWLFMSGTGLPLWSKQFGPTKHNLDPALIAGLLTAIRGFSSQAIGDDSLKDLVLENDKLHNFVITESIIFTVHVDRRVETEKLDEILLRTKDELLKVSNDANNSLADIEKLSVKKFQSLVETITPVLDKLANQLAILRNEFISIYDETSFDSAQLILLSKIPEIVPILTKNQISFTIRDLKTKKIHFQQMYSDIEYDKSIIVTDLMNYLENQNYFLKDLETIPSIFFIGKMVICAFKIPQIQNNMFVIYKDNISHDAWTSTIKLLNELKKKLIDFYK